MFSKEDGGKKSSLVRRPSRCSKKVHVKGGFKAETGWQLSFLEISASLGRVLEVATYSRGHLLVLLVCLWFYLLVWPQLLVAMEGPLLVIVPGT